MVHKSCGLDSLQEMSINKLHMTALVAWLFHVVPHTACLQNSQLLKVLAASSKTLLQSALITALRFAGYQYHRSTIEVPKLCTEHVVERCRQLGESPDCWPRKQEQPIPRKAGKNNHNPKLHFGSLSYKHDSEILVATIWWLSHTISISWLQVMEA